VTLGFGGSGGVFAPAMFIGAAFGAGFAGVANAVSPGAIAEPGAFGLVGMGTLLAAATHAPMTAIFLLFELTRAYDVVVPIMVCGITATVAARALEPRSIDEYELARRGLHLHADGRTRVLHQFFVRSLVDRGVSPIRADATVAELVQAMTTSRGGFLPVVDERGVFAGGVGMDDLRAVLLESQSWGKRRVSELAHRDWPTLVPSDSLFVAFELVAEHGVEQVVVVDEGNDPAVVGVLNRSELQNFYRGRLLARGMVG
jgi:CIC family chloride channel protein